jgi:hypothetical protein
MMTLIKFISLVIVSLALNACQFNSFTFNKGVRGNGVVVTEERSFNDESFNRIEVSTGINLFLTQSDSPSISVQADENIQELIITKVENGTLKIFMDKSTHHVSSKKVVVNFITIDQVKASSGSEVFSTNTLKIPSLDLSSSSGSEIELTVETTHITSSSSSGSQLKLEGKTKEFVGNASSGSQLNASKLTAQFCEVKASSGADLSVKCLEEFDANASSGANIENYETSLKTSVKSSSGGHIHTKN